MRYPIIEAIKRVSSFFLYYPLLTTIGYYHWAPPQWLQNRESFSISSPHFLQGTISAAGSSPPPSPSDAAALGDGSGDGSGVGSFFLAGFFSAAGDLTEEVLVKDSFSGVFLVVRALGRLGASSSSSSTGFFSPRGLRGLVAVEEAFFLRTTFFLVVFFGASSPSSPAGAFLALFLTCLW